MLGQHFLLLTFLSSLCAAAPSAGDPITLATLLREMVDRDSLARWPRPAYRCAQASSYDRGSVSPDDPGWFANSDRSHFVRTEETPDGEEHVMMDVAGPGAIVRFWGTWHGPRGEEFSNGTLRVYLDHAPEPVIEAPIRDVLSGGALVGPPLSQFVSETCPEGNRAHNLYLPIPYSRHCKVTYRTEVLIDRGAREGEALYFQINYRTYEPGTRVEAFSKEALARARPVVDEVQQLLRAAPPRAVAEESTSPIRAALGGGEGFEVLLTGPGAIHGLTLSASAEDSPQALRSTVLEASFDGERTVWCPLEALFGCGYFGDTFRSWYAEVGADGRMTLRWIMPFRRGARLAFRNLGTEQVLLEGEVRSGPWEWDRDSMHFHAVWRQYTERPTRQRDESGESPYQDLNYVTIDGRGVYVGDTLTVFNGARAWWGEGDEKIRVDGEQFPSHFGTGTEDYYGYAWCRPEPFAAPFHAQPRGAGNFVPGFSVNSRYRALDAIPFRKTLQFDMELWHWADTLVNFAPATFWYARPGARCNVEPDPETATLAVAREREDVVPVYHAPGAIEGEELEVVAASDGVTEVQDIPQFRWSGDRQLWWRDAAVGGTLELALPVEEAGRYRVFANLTKAVDYGIVRISLNGVDSGSEYDRYNDGVVHSEVDLGEFRLEAGMNAVLVTIRGANEAAVKRYMFGLDYLRLEASGNRE